MAVVGGQSVQARRLYLQLRQSPHLRVTFQPTTVIHRWRYLRTVVNTFLYLFTLLRRIPKNDIVQIFTAGYFAFFLVAVPPLLLGRLFRKKTIVHFHDGRAADFLERWPGAVKLLQLADVIVTPTGFLVDVLAKFGLRAYPIANTLERETYLYRSRPMPKPIFLHNRGLEREYNVGCTLQAFALVQKRYPEAQLVLANEGSLRKDLEATANSLGLQNVVFSGAVSQAQIVELYDKADIFLSSADADNMPGSILEAFASGLPVIATRAGGTEWLVRHSDNGLLVECGDYKGMADAALQLLSQNGLAERLAAVARLDVSRYSWANTGWKWIELYTRSPPLRSGPIPSPEKLNAPICKARRA